ncbi:MAG: 3-isopropylmalate dehydratase small subunit [Candidatus Omnitrophica bacterium]|jgi:3-isopropylmalate/(R)-2-methylmalate dehydratase small subunit|nr:3-isopropylmalate dehydratase small subunit [Candidatus Omnitrophota bacterium]MDD5080519.1 3-isopropylmalate dehydratase small subunit [Candidatus Omnitrophota bacterium]
MIIKGHAHRFGNDINTDDIIAATYLDSQDPKFLGSKCMENIDKDFINRVKPGDIIVAGKNFGCGSSREHAPVSIKGCGISLVIAESFARIFFRNAINIGLPIIELKDAFKIKEKDLLEVDLSRGIIEDVSTNDKFSTQIFPEFLQEIITYGGLVSWVKGQGVTK